MTETLARQIVGYDPTTERVAVEHPIPVSQWANIAALIPRSEDDPDYVYVYPLDLGLANDIMGMIGQRGAQNLNYFLEAYSAD